MAKEVIFQMEEGVPYVVTKGTACGTFKKGDIISRDRSYGKQSIDNWTAGGFLPYDELGGLYFKVEPDTTRVIIRDNSGVKCMKKEALKQFIEMLGV
jgi:hypothetical protein